MRLASALPVALAALIVTIVDARSASTSGRTLAAPRSRASIPSIVKSAPHDDASLTSSTAPTTSTTIQISRGGAAPSDTTKQVTGAIYFLIMDIALRKIFAAKQISFPSQLAGCCILFVVLVLAELVRPGFGDAAFDVLSPGAALLAKWLPVFFVPGLAMLPLAPSMGSPFEVSVCLFAIVVFSVQNSCIFMQYVCTVFENTRSIAIYISFCFWEHQ